ncbi:MAG TPA: FliA/WhiG family RNA polymerase sigma factor [Desulfobacteraceae bacterium]|nr:FliA/WhiG family RNA polymerase sigma factor [Desulfobacteraceae bacterium]
MMKAGIDRYQRVFDIDQGKIDAKLRQELVIKYAPLVKFIAERMAVRFPPSISKEELISAGIVGLIDALDKFNSAMGIKFQTYAEHRIKGAILDELRKMDWIPRSIRKDIHRIEDATKAVRYRLGREPEDYEIAQEMGVDIDSYYKLSSRAQGITLISLDKLMPDGSTPKFTKQASNIPSPFDELKIKEVKKVISEAILGLSKKEQLVISLYYYDELTLKEIARVLDLTESRISQIHSKAIQRLRAKLRSYYEGR